MKQRELIKYAVIVVLFILPFVMWGVRQYTKRDLAIVDSWYTFPVEDASIQIVPTPADTQGAFGLRACVSPDGTKVAIAGNVSGSLGYAEPAQFANGVAPPEWQKPLKTFLKNIYAVGIDEVKPVFQQVDKNLKIRSIMAMAFSNASPQRLAYISREFAGELPPDFEQIHPYDVSKHVLVMVHETRQITSEYAEYENKPPLFFYRLYVTPLEGGEPKAITLVHPKRNERYQEVDFYYFGHIHVNMDISLCWANDDTGLYYQDGTGVFHVSLEGEVKQIYSLDKDRMFFSQLRAEVNGSISFIERNNIDIAEPSPEGGADELITINSKGQVVSRRKIAEGHQWYHLHEGPFQAVLGRTKWAYAVPEMRDKQVVHGKHIVFVASLQEPFEIQQYRVTFTHKMPYYCIMVGFNADESQLFFTKKFNLFDVKDWERYQPDAPYCELVKIDIE